ncbi:BTAD domain-containing putative transcriptional regulator [Saccharothrix espanaensis]|uniref:BTAD domain-containing putative transcriptional regulator n=1 Tax=Saccharothrix espanaensis TaxID=103731 RepID=UPI00031091F1|nr:BTAD domain-containing putative transcriptional regulator [Saccharothrix espanaensis]
MEFRLLGAVEAWCQEQQLDLGPRKQRFVLAVLALNANQLVPVDRLVDLTWPARPPRTAYHGIHVMVSRLRRAIASARTGLSDVEILTRGSAYVLKLDPLSIDVHRFRARVADARRETDDEARVHLLRRALALWHGPPLADVATSDVATMLCQGLEDARLSALEECLDAELRLGRHTAVVDELTDLAARHPYRQGLHAQLMLALYRCGRVTDALEAYRAARSRLADEQALEPESRLSTLQRAILRADPALDAPRAREPVRVLPPRRAWSPPARTADVVVEARGLSKWFGGRSAVESVSFTARVGEVIGLLGPNGAGKTTTIRLLSTVLAPSGGEFSVAGVPGSRAAEVRARIGVLPEGAGYPARQTGVEYLAYHARLFGRSRGQAARVAAGLVEQVGLAGRGGSRIGSYSRGMRQRLGIARALVNDPVVVFLDEPTSGLDPAGQREILGLVAAIASGRGTTVVLSTHTLPEVEEICTGVLVMERGRVVADRVLT